MKKQQIENIKKVDPVVFEKKLQAMAMEGKFDFAFDDIGEEALSPEEMKRFYKTARKASQENALIKAREGVTKVELPFGRHLQKIRNASGLSQLDVANLLKKNSPYVEKIENGHINPLNLSANDLADIMEVFRLSLTELKAAINEFLSFLAVKPPRVSAMARSSIKAGTKEKGDSVAHAVDATLQAIAKAKKKNKEQEKKLEIDQNYLEDLQKLLKNRGLERLLI